MRIFGAIWIAYAIASVVLEDSKYSPAFVTWINAMDDRVWIARGVVFVVGMLMILIGTEQQGNPRVRSNR